MEEPLNCRSNYWLQTLILSSKNMKFRNKLIEKLIYNGLQSRPIWTLLHKIRHLNKFQSDDLKTSINLEKILTYQAILIDINVSKFKKIQRIIVSPDTTIYDVIKNLSDPGLRIVLVEDEKKFLGF